MNRVSQWGWLRIVRDISCIIVLVSGGATAAAGQTVVYGDPGSLDARLYAPVGNRLQFAVTRPAYVAIFEIVPGRGMSMLFPVANHEVQRRFAAGSHSYTAPGFSLGRSLYRQVDFGSYHDPTYLLLIASERPLRVQRMLRLPSALLTELGFSTYYSMANIHAVRRLAEHIVPDPDMTEWTYDTYAAWPSERQHAIAAYRVVCADGRTRLITSGFVPRECLRHRGVRPATRDTSARDSSEYPSRKPWGRRPRTKPEVGEHAIDLGRNRPAEWRNRPASRRSELVDRTLNGMARGDRPGRAVAPDAVPTPAAAPLPHPRATRGADSDRHQPGLK